MDLKLDVLEYPRTLEEIVRAHIDNNDLRIAMDRAAGLKKNIEKYKKMSNFTDKERTPSKQKKIQSRKNGSTTDRTFDLILQKYLRKAKARMDVRGSTDEVKAEVKEAERILNEVKKNADEVEGEIWNKIEKWQFTLDCCASYKDDLKILTQNVLDALSDAYRAGKIQVCSVPYAKNDKKTKFYYVRRRVAPFATEHASATLGDCVKIGNEVKYFRDYSNEKSFKNKDNKRQRTLFGIQVKQLDFGAIDYAFTSYAHLGSHDPANGTGWRPPSPSNVS
jgi:chromosome segregation ATPase